ncbi:MAG: hypothetical protein EBR82_86755, partial [Caulobacteraceae bacterium]|nr:hypothetical protein [Caulobacteraceae bacterium]
MGKEQGMNKAEFAELISSVMAYYKQDCSPFVVDIWWSACQAYDFEQVQKALTQPSGGQLARPTISSKCKRRLRNTLQILSAVNLRRRLLTSFASYLALRRTERKMLGLKSLLRLDELGLGKM